MPPDQRKILAVIAQHPEIELAIVFSNSKKWFRKAKTKTYAKWCEKHGITYCDWKDFRKVLPQWLKNL